MDAQLQARIDRARAAVKIQDLVGLDQPLKPVSADRWIGDTQRGGHDSLVVTPSRGLWFWNAKAEGGGHIAWLKFAHDMTFWDALKELEAIGGISSDAPRDLPPAGPIEAPRPAPPPPVLPMALVDTYYRNLQQNTQAQAWWLKKHGLGEQDWELWKLGWKPDHWHRGPSSSIPVTQTVAGQTKLLTLRHRVWHADKVEERYLPETKGLGAHMFNTDLLFDTTVEHLHIWEGEIKAMVGWRFGLTVVGIPGCRSVKAEWLPWMAQHKKVFVTLDPDPTLDPMTVLWILKLSQMTEVRVIDCPMKPDDYLLASPSKAPLAYEAMRRGARLVRVKGPLPQPGLPPQTTSAVSSSEWVY